MPEMTRLRDLGFRLGRLPTGRLNSITDVDGVTVGHSTIIEGDGPLEIGRGPVRTGVTAVVPHAGDVWEEPLYAASHTLNGTGEWTGLQVIEETGLLYGPIFLTNSHSIGTVRDAIIKRESRLRNDSFMALPVVGETFDGFLNDIAGLHVTARHVEEALEHASDVVLEGNVGGGTGMVSHDFKGGAGTASRIATTAGRSVTVGVQVQANHGERDDLIIDGAPVGEMIGDKVELPFDRAEEPNSVREKNSLLVVIAVDAPLLPHQLRRVAQRATLGIARSGTTAEPNSGEFSLAFSTVQQAGAVASETPRTVTNLTTLSDSALAPIFVAAAEATHEAILNAMMAAETMTGRDGNVAPALSAQMVVDTVLEFHRLRTGELGAVAERLNA
jgi:D-aminopeptidase